MTLTIYAIASAKEAIENKVGETAMLPAMYLKVLLDRIAELEGAVTNQHNALIVATSISDSLWSKGHRLALELECLLMDTKDNVIVSKWWDSAHEALYQWRNQEESE